MANRDTLFITAEYVKARTNVDPNVDDKYIGNAIWEAQRFHLMQTLGSGLYDELETQFDAGTLTALNQTLMHKYIAPCLKYWSLVNLIPYMIVKMTNKGAVTKNSDNSNPSDSKAVDIFIEDLTNKAQYMAKELKDYLIENSNSYPLYLNPGSSSDTIHPDKDVFDQGIFLGNSGYNKNVPFGYRMDNPGTYGCDEDYE